MSESYDLLGSAEKLIIKQLTSAVASIRLELEEGLRLVGCIEEQGNFEEKMLDPESRELLVKIAEKISGLPASYTAYNVGLLLLGVAAGADMKVPS